MEITVHAGRMRSRPVRTVVAVADAAGLTELLDARPAVAVIEVELAGTTNGVEVLCDLHATYGPDLPVLLLSSRRTTPHERAAGFLLGADDYVTKPFDCGEFHARLRRLLQRAQTSTPNQENPNAHFALSPREKQILALLTSGRSQQDIAATLFISSKTVATHIQHLLTKLNVHSRAQAVALAFRRGLVPPTPIAKQSRDSDAKSAERPGTTTTVTHRRFRWPVDFGGPAHPDGCGSASGGSRGSS